MTSRQAQVAAAKLARKAAAVIEERGWCQGGYTNKKGNVCLYGALNLAAGANDPSEPFTLYRKQSGRALKVAVRDALAGPDLAAWNDEPGRRKRDVLKLLNTVADKLQAGEYE